MIQFDIPKDKSSIIKVFGVGGGGSNAVNHMYEQGIEGVNYIICNTDNQALEMSKVPNKIQLGKTLRQGLGAGSKPEIGRQATEEAIDLLEEILQTNTKMVFITAGMGGGTGTGGAPVVARLAKDMDILTIAIVTTPFSFEGKKRHTQAQAGIEELKKEVDALLIISNDKLREIYGNLPMSDAFGKADDILTVAAKGIAEIITKTGLVNVDFEDVNTVMRNSGVALLGIGSASGENRSKEAINQAMNSPLLNDNNILGARRVLLNISFGEDEITMDEMGEITEYVQKAIGVESDNFIFGLTQDQSLKKDVRVTLIATGFESNEEIKKRTQEPKQIVYTLEEQQKIKQQKDKTKPYLKSEKEQPSQEDSQQISFDFDSFNNSQTAQKEPFNDEKKDQQGIQESNNTFDFDAEQQKIEETLDERLDELHKYKSRSKITGKSIEEMENIPAYIRKNVDIKDDQKPSDDDVSSYSLGKSNEKKQLGKNSFLHDNVD